MTRRDAEHWCDDVPGEVSHRHRRYFAYVIESGEGLNEGRELEKLFSSAGIPYSCERPRNADDFRRCLGEYLVLALTQLAGNEIPLFHLSMHGFVGPRTGSRPSTIGFELASGGTVRWPGLRGTLSKLNDDFGGRLILSVSACHGIQADSIAMRTDRPDPPFYAMVANSREVKVAESETAFVAFYRLLLTGGSLEEAVREMRAASGNENFFLHYGHDTTEPFIRLMENIRKGQLGPDLRERYRANWEAKEKREG